MFVYFLVMEMHAVATCGRNRVNTYSIVNKKPLDLFGKDWKDIRKHACKSRQDRIRFDIIVHSAMRQQSCVDSTSCMQAMRILSCPLKKRHKVQKQWVPKEAREVLRSPRLLDLYRSFSTMYLQ